MNEDVEKELRSYLAEARAANGWRSHFESKLNHVCAIVEVSKNASIRAVDETMAIRKEFSEHVRDVTKHQAHVQSALASHAEWKRHTEARLNQIQGNLDDVEDDTDKILLSKLDSVRAKARVEERKRAALLKWIAGIVATLIVSFISAGTGYAIKGMLAEARTVVPGAP